MTEPLGYRILARRLARDLGRLVRDQRPELVIGECVNYDRLFDQAERTLDRFIAYERTHKGLKQSTRPGRRRRR